jgi:hypothetical protein
MLDVHTGTATGATTGLQAARRGGSHRAFAWLVGSWLVRLDWACLVNQHGCINDESCTNSSTVQRSD